MILFIIYEMSSIGKSIGTKYTLVVAQGLKEWGYRISSWGHENILIVIMVMVPQLCIE